MKSAKAMVLLACIVVLALCLGIYSEERDPPPPERTTRTSTKITRSPAPTARTSGKIIRIPEGTTQTSTKITRIPERIAEVQPSGKVIRVPARTARTPSRRVRPPEDPYKDSVVMLEAIMVQARLSALYSADIPVISQCCNSVSAEQILKVLKTTENAQVTAGAKLTLTQDNQAKAESTARQGTYISPAGKGRIEYVEVGTSFTAVARIRSERKISVTLEFKHSSREQSDGDSDIAPPFVERSWETLVSLEPGKPTLVGATQDNKIATFLIMTASIKD